MKNILDNEESKPPPSQESIQQEKIQQVGTYIVNTCDDETSSERPDKEFEELFKGNAEAHQAYEILMNTNESVFLTGNAGTGKSLFIKLVKSMKGPEFVLAPTGLSARVVDGETIHSALKMPIAFFVPIDFKFEDKFFSKDFIYWLITGVHIIVIDEISMVSSAMLDCIDIVLQRLCGNNKLFGGKQMLFVGDPFQLPPIIKKEDRAKLSRHYASEYFFESNAFKALDPIRIELKKNYRQRDDIFLSCLDKIRRHKEVTAAMDVINSGCIHQRSNVEDVKQGSSIALCYRNDDAHLINHRRFQELTTDLLIFEAKEVGRFIWGGLRVERRLELREGARVMLTKNHSNGLYVNGTLGHISILTPDKVIVTPDEGDSFEVEREKWYTYERKNYQKTNKKWVTEYIEVGSMTQFPLVHAWAISVHKSQGLTFDNVYLHNLGYSFANGQTYVALSRARSLEGLTLLKKLEKKDFKSNKDVLKFYKTLKSEKRIKQILKDIQVGKENE